MQDIIIRGLCKSFGEKAVLCNVSGTLAAGRITGLMAPSGAGKTTLLRILMGLERADSGRIDGLNGLCISAVFQEDRLCNQLDGVSNLRLVTPALGRAESRECYEGGWTVRLHRSAYTGTVRRTTAQSSDSPWAFG